MKVAPASSTPRNRRITTLPVESPVTSGSCSSSAGAVAKKMLPYGWSTTTCPPGTSAGGAVSRIRPSTSCSCRIRSRLDCRTTCRTIDSPTPTSTAYCSGTISVSTNVVAMTVSWTAPVRATESTCRGRTAPAPTTISSPASAGIATYPMTPPSSRMISAITAPAKSRASRVRAPAATIRELADMDPPTGIPWNRAAATFPVP